MQSKLPPHPTTYSCFCVDSFFKDPRHLQGLFQAPLQHKTLTAGPGRRISSEVRLGSALMMGIGNICFTKLWKITWSLSKSRRSGQCMFNGAKNFFNDHSWHWQRYREIGALAHCCWECKLPLRQFCNVIINPNG